MKKEEKEFRNKFQSIEGKDVVLKSGIAKWFIDEQLKFISENYIAKSYLLNWAIKNKKHRLKNNEQAIGYNDCLIDLIKLLTIK